MASSDFLSKLCRICSELYKDRLVHPVYPCTKPMPCWEAPIDREHATSGGEYEGYLELGSLDDIKDRRSECDICKLVAECLDKEPSGLVGRCRITETEAFCRFEFPGILVGDSSITHCHITQTSVLFDSLNEFEGPALPWEIKANRGYEARHVLILQPKARSTANPGDLGSISPQTEQTIFDTIGGRYVSTQVDTQLVRAWLEQCECEHGKGCASSLGLLAETYKHPTFVIDVVESCLVETSPQYRYIALSYVWGKAAVFRHLSKHTRNLRETGSLNSLPIPATIRDAMTLVHAIGERYLWVDSICIVQDDLQMQQTEIMRMGSIYAGALFTIIAAAGDHANSSLPGVRPGSREQVQKVLKFGDCELLTIIDLPNASQSIDETSWAQRAWTFQEQVMSNRMLVFSKNQVYWTCRKASHSEERALEGIPDIERLYTPFSQKNPADYLEWKSLPPLDYAGRYRELLYNYRLPERRLTYQTDILNAFSGITETLGRLQKDTFFWGLPESFFSLAMTWETIGACARNGIEVPVLQGNESKTMIQIPSWSWAAWSAEHSTNFEIVDGFNQLVQPLVQFNIVDNKRQLIAIKEPSLHGQPDDHIRALLQNAPPHQPQSLLGPSLLQIGQLQFWTCHGTTKVVRWLRPGAKDALYEFFPRDNFQDDLYPIADRYELLHQDFIVIAGRGPERLHLLAIEWKDGVAYRVGHTDISWKHWLSVENREWRLITLG